MKLRADKHRCNVSEGGFTLVEAVLALAIMCISAFTLMAAASQCLSVARTARNYHAAVAVLDKGELEHPYSPTNDIEDIKVDPETDDNGFTFSRTVEPFDESDEYEKGLYVVRTRVSWSLKGRTAFEEVSTFLYNTNEVDVGM